MAVRAGGTAITDTARLRRLGKAGAEEGPMTKSGIDAEGDAEAANRSLDVESLGQDVETAPSSGFDKYKSFSDPNLLIFVKNDAVPPFRFRAGGWDLEQSSIKLGPAMIARIAERGFFMCRVNEDQSGWTELTDLAALPGSG
jgi:hypothetical protein